MQKEKEIGINEQEKAVPVPIMHKIKVFKVIMEGAEFSIKGAEWNVRQL